MTTHELKTHPEPFAAVLDGRKRFEIRVNDRDFRVADHLLLREWDPATEQYTGAQARFRVTYMSTGPDWRVPCGLAVMSIARVMVRS